MNGANEMGLTGEEIKQNVLIQLSNHPELNDERISVDLEGEELTLFGDVESDDKKWLAERVAYDVLGVVHVNNKLNVYKDQSS